MRFGTLLDGTDWGTIVGDARAAEAVGMTLGLLLEHDADGTRRNACALACALAPHTRDLRLVVELAAGSHPIGFAEELAVTDQLLNGRLVGAISGEDPAEVEETVVVIRSALASRPFSHVGSRWQLPLSAEHVRVMPAPAQLEMPLWLLGRPLAELAGELGLPWLDAAPPCSATHGEPRGVRLDGAIRPALHVASTSTDGALAVADLVARLRAERAAWGLDCCIVKLPAHASHGARRRLIELIGSRVAPQLELDQLSDALVNSWDDGSGPRDVA
jgi:hypothetical protein